MEEAQLLLAQVGGDEGCLQFHLGRRVLQQTCSRRRTGGQEVDFFSGLILLILVRNSIYLYVFLSSKPSPCFSCLTSADGHLDGLFGRFRLVELLVG